MSGEGGNDLSLLDGPKKFFIGNLPIKKDWDHQEGIITLFPGHDLFFLAF